MSECTISLGGTKRWYHNGNLHREDGPAVEWYHGTKEWFLNGKLHRLDGPAIIHAGGRKEWWINHKFYTEEEFILLQFSRGIMVHV